MLFTRRVLYRCSAVQVFNVNCFYRQRKIRTSKDREAIHNSIKLFKITWLSLIETYNGYTHLSYYVTHVNFYVIGNV